MAEQDKKGNSAERKDLEPIEALARGELFQGPPDPEEEPEKKPRKKGRLITTIIGLTLIIGAAAVVIVVLLSQPDFESFLPSPGSTGTTITSIPGGASLYINDAYLGRTPRTISSWALGINSVRIERRGFLEAETLIVIEDDDWPDLAPFVLSKRISIRSIPPGADILLDGESVSATRTAGIELKATDTVVIEAQRADFVSPPSLRLTVDGPISPYDSTSWRIEVEPDEGRLSLTALMLRSVTISSRPPGAQVYVGESDTAMCTTPCPVTLPLGTHRLTIRHGDFLPHSFDLEVTADSPERFSAVLRRYVWLTATGEGNDTTDIGARIHWVRREGRVIEDFEYRQQTPYSLNLPAYEHEVRLTHPDYFDTIISIPAEASHVQTTLREREQGESSGRRSVLGGNLEEFKWVRFRVKSQGDPVPQARIIGRRAESDREFEFGMTGKEGELLAKVPPGRFEFYAVRDRDKSDIRTTNITPGRRIKSITLRF